MDSMEGHPLPFPWHEGSTRVTEYKTLPLPTIIMDTFTRSRQRNGGRAQVSRRQSVSIPVSKKKRGKRDGKKKRSKRGGLRRHMTKAERLSKKNFRVCSWNCASARKRGAVLEKLAYDFNVLCLQETRTSSEKPIEMADFIVLQKHGGRGMAIAIRKNSQTTISPLNMERW